MDLSDSGQTNLFDVSTTGDSSQELNAGIYARTSSPGQKHGYSLDAQIRQCWKRCQQMGWVVTHVFRDEAVSGKNKERPMFQQLLSRAESEAFDVVVFWKLDRFSRSLIHAVELEKQFREWGVALHSVTEQIDTTTPTGRFNFRNISSASEFERELIQQRSQMGMQGLAKDHKWPNDHPPLGYKKCADNTLEIIESEAELVRKIFERYKEAKSMPKVAEELNENEIDTKKDGDWNARAVGDILQNELYLGRYNVADIEDHVPEYQIISEDLFDEVTKIRTRFRREDTASRTEMDQSRKEQRVESILDQFNDFLDR